MVPAKLLRGMPEHLLRCQAAGRGCPWAGAVEDMAVLREGSSTLWDRAPGSSSTSILVMLRPGMLPQPPSPCLQLALQHPTGQDAAPAEPQVLQSLWRPCLRCINMERNSLFLTSPFKRSVSTSPPDRTFILAWSLLTPQSPKGPHQAVMPGGLWSLSGELQLQLT